MEILFKSDNDPIFIYDVAIYKKNDCASFIWSKCFENTLDSKRNIVMVITTKEPTFDERSHATLEGALKYKYDQNEFLLPLKNLKINALDIVNGTLDPILQNDNQDPNNILAVYALSVVTTLNFHFLSEPQESMIDIFKHNLGYVNNFNNNPNILWHSKSPLHILHGSALLISKINDTNLEYEITVMSRSEEQLLMLINIMYDVIPTRILIIPTGYSIELKNVQSQKHRVPHDTFTEEMDFTQDMNPFERNAVDKLANILHEQMSLVINYLEKCIDEMVDVKIIEENNKNDTSMNINILQLGVDSFKKFWNTLDEQNKLKNSIIKDLL